jgi:4,5-DOPA dioxygenase extradiol
VPMNEAPALFVSHGAPTFALEPGELGPKLTALRLELGGLRAVVVASAHWQTHGVQLTHSAAPKTMHDFGGFPAALYQLQYPAPGAPALASSAAELLRAAGFDVSFDEQRGLDHGVWVPMRYLLPAARTPVFQVSLPLDLNAQGAIRLGQALAPLRRQGVLVMGSGSLTHNLREIFDASAAATTYAAEFTEWVRGRVQARDIAGLTDYRRRAPHALRAHPTEEHFLPLLIALGASDAADEVTVIEGGMTYGVLSMESYAFRQPAAGAGG